VIEVHRHGCHSGDIRGQRVDTGNYIVNHAEVRSTITCGRGRGLGNVVDAAVGVGIGEVGVSKVGAVRLSAVRPSMNIPSTAFWFFPLSWPLSVFPVLSVPEPPMFLWTPRPCSHA